MKSRQDWSSADSAREMKRWLTSSAPPMDPIVRQTVESLAENMWFFLETIRGRVAKYQKALDEVKLANPNAALLADVNHAGRGLQLENEEAFLTLHIRRYIVSEAEDETEEKPKDEAAAAAAAAPVVTAEPASEKEGAPVTPAAAEEAAEDDSDDDTDDDDAYDCVEAIPVKFPDNKALVLRMAQLKHAGTELLTVFSGIADWIALSIPDIQLDDNDSVDVMNTVLETTQSYIEAIETTKTFHREYLDERTDMEVSILKFPHSASMRRSLLATDLDCWNEVERGWQTLTRCSLILHTLLSNNMKKLVNPRGGRQAAIYQ